MSSTPTIEARARVMRIYAEYGFGSIWSKLNDDQNVGQLFSARNAIMHFQNTI